MPKVMNIINRFNLISKYFHISDYITGEKTPLIFSNGSVTKNKNSIRLLELQMEKSQ